MGFESSRHAMFVSMRRVFGTMLCALVLTACAHPDQEAFDEFAEDEADLRCEIADACGSESPWECEPPRTHEFDRCDSFQEDRAAECLEDLETALSVIQMAQDELVLDMACSVAGEVNCANPVSDGEPDGPGVCAMSL